MALTLGVAGVILLLVVVGRMSGRHAPAPPPHAAPPAEKVVETPAKSTAPPMLNRADLLAAAAEAADRYAAGQAMMATEKLAAGRRFELALPFGCSGPGAAAGLDPAIWTFDLKKKTITAAAKPQVWTDTPWVRALLGPQDDIEAVEGFWIPRPWLTHATCPAPRQPLPGPTPQPASEPSVGVVQTFRADASRIDQRGGRAYQVVRKAAEAELAAAPRELRLTLGGRIAALDGGDTVRCYGAAIDQRPACLIGVEVDRVAISDPATSEVWAQWSR